jgi:hypothetical protein
MGTNEMGLGMVTETPNGLLEVRPLYINNDARPKALQVSLLYRPYVASQMDNAAVGEAVTAAKKQMDPEYDVTSNVERIKGGLAIFFMIVETEKK